MVALARNQINTPEKLNWYLTINNTLTDAAEIGFQIWDISAGTPGTQIFPASGWQDVTSNAGHVTTGTYYAYDSATSAGWRVPLGEPLGSHLIKWRWKIAVSAPYQQGQEEFEVLVESVGSTTDTYASIQDFRDLGIEEDDVSDEELTQAIALGQALIEKLTRQWFVPRTVEFAFDGDDTDTIFFSVPIIDIEWLRINGEQTQNLDPSYYRVYNGRSVPDDRSNPKIRLGASSPSIFTTPTYPIFTTRSLRFWKGVQNQRVRGTFGYVDQNGQTPAPIKEALMRLVVERLSKPAYGTPPIVSTLPTSGAGAVIEEWTDGHKMKYASGSITTRSTVMEGISADPFVQDVIRLYRAPLGIAVPR